MERLCILLLAAAAGGLLERAHGQCVKTVRRQTLRFVTPTLISSLASSPTSTTTPTLPAVTIPSTTATTPYDYTPSPTLPPPTTTPEIIAVTTPTPQATIPIVIPTPPTTATHRPGCPCGRQRPHTRTLLLPIPIISRQTLVQTVRLTPTMPTPPPVTVIQQFQTMLTAVQQAPSPPCDPSVNCQEHCPGLEEGLNDGALDALPAHHCCSGSSSVQTS